MYRYFSSCFAASLQWFPASSFLFKSSRHPRTSCEHEQDQYEPVKKPTIVIDNLDSLSFHSGFDTGCDKENRRCSSARSAGDRYAGKVNFTIQYIAAKKTLIIKIKDCLEIDWECFETDMMSQVRVTVSCAKSPKQQTGFHSGFHPSFNEILLFTNIEENDLLACHLRFRLYTKKSRTKPVLKGEAEFNGVHIPLEGPPTPHCLKLDNPGERGGETERRGSSIRGLHRIKNHELNQSKSESDLTKCVHRSSFKYQFQEKMNQLTSHGSLRTTKREQQKSAETLGFAGLSPVMHRGSTSQSGDSRRSSMVDASGRFCSQPNNDAAELLVSLCYYSEHGRLIVGVERGSLPQTNEHSKHPDTFVRVIAQGEYGNELSKQKTDTVKASSEPRYDYSASFQIPQSELESISIVLQVWTWSGVLRRKSQIGWFALGLNSTSPDAQEHWEQMIQGLGTTVSKWHSILPPE